LYQLSQVGAVTAMEKFAFEQPPDNTVGQEAQLWLHDASCHWIFC